MGPHAQQLRRRGLLAGTVGAASSWLLGCQTDDVLVASAGEASPLPEARPLTTVLAARKTRDGAGVALARSIGNREIPLLDPFLLLDEMKSDDPTDYQAGFPTHPHRGFETVTYMLHGAMEHRDSMGSRGRIEAGSVQWMTAGRGVLHSEMPRQTSGLLWGFQLWVNLPARLKMSAARYQEIASNDIPDVWTNGGQARVIAGAAADVTGPVEGIFVAPTMLDVTVPVRGAFSHELPPSHTVFAYVLDGVLQLGSEARTVRAGEIAVFGAGQVVTASATGSSGRMLLVAAEPIGERVARRGPFVMNTDEELDQAFEDYRAGRIAG